MEKPILGTSPDRPGQRFLKPATAELLVAKLSPRGARLSPGGEWVAFDRYWARRMLRGDVVACDPPAPKPTKKKD